MTGTRARWEWIAVVAIMLIAAAFRLLALNDVPPGLHHDEVIIGQVAKDILRGHLAIYFTPGYGHEPLYHYTLAGMFALVGANAFVLRLTSAFIALLGLAVTYRFVRKIFSPAVALGTLAWMAVSLWPIFFSRVGLRGIALPLLSTLTAYLLWKALHAPRTIHYVIAGGSLGLTLYTYQASRTFPIVFFIFIAYLFAMRRLSSRSPSLLSYPSSLSWRRVALFFATALIVAAPLIIYLTVINPGAEERIADLSGPLTQLRAGNPSEVIQSTLNTLGMFTIKGDAVSIYNVGGRPVFPEPIGAALFYIGLLICIWRWKQPAYALMLIWFFISLIPAMITPFSPNFVRTIAVWPVPFVFVGIGMMSIGQLVNWAIGRLGDRSTSQPGSRHLVTLSPSHLLIGLFGIILIINAFLTARDYFVEWPKGDYVRFWQQASWTQAVRAINADPATTPVVVSGLSVQDLDPQTFDLLGVRSDVKVKWSDCRNAVLYPYDMEQPAIRYLSPPFFKCDDDLKASYLPSIRTVEQPQWPNSGDAIFLLEQFDRPWTLSELLLPRVMTSTAYLGAENFDPISPTRDLVEYDGLGRRDFEGLRFYGNTPHPNVLTPGATLTFDTVWDLTRPISAPLKIFIHITAPDGKIIAQWDGLDVNVGTLDAGDMFVQRQRVELPADLPPGPYRISLGAYHPDTGVRLSTTIDDRRVDALVLGTLSLVK